MQIFRAMSEASLTPLTNIALRAVTMGSRIVLVMLLARYLSPSDLGLFGLVAVTIAYTLYFVGLDFYTFSTREIIASSRDTWGNKLVSQVALSGLLYVCAFPIAFIVFFSGILPWSLGPWFAILLVLEHFAQEVDRLLIAISRPLLASWVQFLRSGSWVFVLSVLIVHSDEARNLHVVLALWTVGGVLSCSVGGWAVFSLRAGGWGEGVDWEWLRKGVRIAIPLLVGTLAIQAITTIDRYWVKILIGGNALGAYVLFIGIANALTAVLSAGVFTFTYPRLIEAATGGCWAAFTQCIRRAVGRVLIVIVVFSLATLTLLPALANWLSNSVYLRYSYLYPWLLLSSVVYNLGLIPHYGLYAQRIDRPIATSHVAAALTFMPVVLLVAPLRPDLSVPIGLIVASVVTLAWKWFALVRLSPVPMLQRTGVRT